MPGSLREHLGGRAIAFAMWLGGKCDAFVYDDPGKPKVPYRTPCDTEDAAQKKADQLLLAAHPHDCTKEKCRGWVKVA